MEEIIIPKELVLQFFNETWKKPLDEFATALYTSRKHKGESLQNPGADFFVRYLNSLRESPQVLDLACGDGRYAIKCAKKGMHVTAVDFSREGINRLKERAVKLGLSSVIKYLVQDITKIKLQPRIYEGIISTDAFHYLNDEELESLIKKIKTATKIGGLNCISFETEIDMMLPDGRRFRFANQPKRYLNEVKNFFKKNYSDWQILYDSVIKHERKPLLGSALKNFFNTKYDHMFRNCTLYEIVCECCRFSTS